VPLAPPLAESVTAHAGNARTEDVRYEFGPVGDFLPDTSSAPPSLGTAEGATYWVWQRQLDAPTVGLAHSIRADNDAHSEEFFAGVLLGLAGAAAIAAVQALLEPRRRAKPAAGPPRFP
jgi:hypothetical protein